MNDQTISIELNSNNIAPKRGRGRPRKLPIKLGELSTFSSSTANISLVTSPVQYQHGGIILTKLNEPSRPRGRPRKEMRKEIVIQLKRPRGRPRLSEPKPIVPGRSRGRPRIHPLKDPNGPKKPRGRPPKPNEPKAIIEKPSRPRGRPRKDRSFELPKRPRGRPRKNAVHPLEGIYQQGDSNSTQYSFAHYSLQPQTYVPQSINGLINNNHVPESNSINYIIPSMIHSSEYNTPETNGLEQHELLKDDNHEDAAKTDYFPPEFGNLQKANKASSSGYFPPAASISENVDNSFDGSTYINNNESMQFDVTNSAKSIPFQDSSNVPLEATEETLPEQEPPQQYQQQQQQAIPNETKVKSEPHSVGYSVQINVSANATTQQVGSSQLTSSSPNREHAHTTSNPYQLEVESATPASTNQFEFAPPKVNQAGSTSTLLTTISGHTNLSSNIRQTIPSKANNSSDISTATSNLDFTNNSKPKKAFDFYAKCILMKQEKEKKSKNPKRKYEKE